MLKHKKLLFTLILLFIALGYLFWPLGDPSYRIATDPSSLAEKNAFLERRTGNVPTGSPNIILITVDDLGMADNSLYGEGDIETPNIDRLGENGVVFENAYVTSPVCSPSRAALITGRYQHRFGFEFTMHDRYLRNRMEYLGFRYFVDSDPWVARWADAVPDRQAIDQQGLPLSEVTLAEVLRKNGYYTGIVGKWHLGWSPEKRPSAFGFEEQYGFFHSHSLYAPEGTPGIVDQKISGDWTDPHIWSGQRDGAHAIHRNNIKIEENGYLTDRITDEAIGFMERNSDRPFFLWVSYNAPHTPLQAPEEYVNRFIHVEDPVKRVYRAMISCLDDNIGRLTEFISLTGMDENTLIFFISDNGGAEYTLTTDNGEYDGGKNTEFEGGIKVPMIIQWTGTIPGGKRYRPMVSSLDIFPTAANAARAETMTGRTIDGIDLVPYLTDSLSAPPHDFLYWKRGNSKVVRSNDWKLMINEFSGDTLLYNLALNKYEDPDESGDWPDVVAELTGAYAAWSGMHRPPLWPSVVYYIGKKDSSEYYFEQ